MLCGYGMTTILCWVCSMYGSQDCSVSHSSPPKKTRTEGRAHLSTKQLENPLKPLYKTRGSPTSPENFINSKTSKTSQEKRSTGQGSASNGFEVTSHSVREETAAMHRLPSACTAAPSSTCPSSVHLFACLIVRNGHTVRFTGKQEASCLHHTMKNKPHCQPWEQLNYCEYDLPAMADEDKPALVPFQKTCLGEPEGC